MGELSDFRVGQTVELQDGRTATVQFVGSAHFAAGDWIGVELEDATGKNDGSVQGERYFDCEPGHGMFVRPAAAAVTAEPAPKPVRALVGKTNGTTSRSRPQSAMVSGLRRQSILDPMAAKRQSINAGSPTPSSRGLRVCPLSRNYGSYANRYRSPLANLQLNNWPPRPPLAMQHLEQARPLRR